MISFMSWVNWVYMQYCFSFKVVSDLIYSHFDRKGGIILGFYVILVIFGFELLFYCMCVMMVVFSGISGFNGENCFAWSFVW